MNSPFGTYFDVLGVRKDQRNVAARFVRDTKPSVNYVDWRATWIDDPTVDVSGECRIRCDA